jgi:integrase
MSTKTGIEPRHARSCRARKGGRCNCSPTWRASIWNPQTKTLIRRVFNGEHAKIEAQLWRADGAKARSMGALRASTRLTVGQAGDDLIVGMRDGTILDRSGKRYKPATIRTYEYALDVAIKPALGNKALGAVTQGDAQALVDDLHASGLSASTVRNRLDPLRVIYRRARRRGQVVIDPMRDLDVPTGRGRRERVATRQEAEELIGALPGGERALWATAIYRGLRRGEMRALRWSDLDLAGEPGTIHIQRTWDDIEGEVPTKSDAGDDLVFGRSSTLPFIASTVRSRALRAWDSENARRRRSDPDAALIVPVTLHEGRHSNASYLIEAGLNDLELTATIGHSDPRTTKMIYGHLFPDSAATVVAKIDAYLDADGG